MKHSIINILQNFLSWFDTHSAPQEENIPETEKSVEWVRILPFLAVHLMCFGVIWVGWSPIAVGVCITLYFVRMFAITGFYHRYFSHRTFRTTRAAQFVFALIGNSSAQRGPLWWAAHHRKHHRHSDEEDDVHSPHQHSFLWSHMFWFTSRANFATDTDQVKDLMKYPELRLLDRFDVVVPALLGTGLFFLGVFLNHFYPSLGTSGMQMLIWGFFISTVLLFHGTCTINSLSHKFGSQRFDTGDHSKNNFILSLITLGEGWHNNHHYYPAATRQGFYWWEVDLTYYGLKTLSWLGIVWDLNAVPERILEKGRESGKRAA